MVKPLNNCTFASLCTALITGFLLLATFTPSDPDETLKKTNEALKAQLHEVQAALLDATKSSDKIYADAIKGLQQAKVELEAEKKRIAAECK